MTFGQDEITAGLRRKLTDRRAARAALEGDKAAGGELFQFLADQGLLAMALPERLGGSGLGLDATAAVAELLSYHAAPTPVLPAFLAAHLLGALDGERVESLAGDLAAGRRVGVCLSAGAGAGDLRVDAEGRIEGALSDILDGAELETLIVHAGGAWWAVEARDAQLARVEALDVTRPMGSATFAGTAAVKLGAAPAQGVEALAWIYLAAEALGAAQASLDLAAEHARVRKQFGQPIGRFQAIKQKLADCLLATEAARSTLWGAVKAQPSGWPDERAARSAKAIATQAAVMVAHEAIQTHGAMGVTWEHDLHLLQRRAKHCQLALGAPEAHLAATAEGLLADARSGRRLADRSIAPTDLEPEDEAFVAELREWLDGHATPERLEAVKRGGIAALRAWQAEMADGGWVGVHWPKAYGGRDATFTQQVLYHAELTARGLPRLVGNRGLTIVAPTLIKHGSPFQQELLEPTRRADILWSTAFSEPGAGSDLAGLQTRGVIEGDELVITGTKIWTSQAHISDWMYSLIRTGPMHPKHDGITCVVMPLKIDGLTIQPIRLNNGAHHFNQLFFDGVRIPLSYVVGPINEGWRKVNRTTMAHEHFTNFLGTHAGYANVIEHILRRLAEREAGGQVDHDLRRRAALSWITVQLLRLNGMRNVVRIQAGQDPGAEGSIQKVLGQEEERRLYELALDVMGAGGLAFSRWGRAYLSSRAATIGGGTSEIHRNKLAEQVLGLPRDIWADDSGPAPEA